MVMVEVKDKRYKCSKVIFGNKPSGKDNQHVNLILINDMIVFVRILYFMLKWIFVYKIKQSY